MERSIPKYKPMLSLKLKRVSCGFTQAQLAEKAGISQNSISIYEKGRSFPQRDTLDRLAKALGCEAKDLI